MFPVQELVRHQFSVQEATRDKPLLIYQWLPSWRLMEIHYIKRQFLARIQFCTGSGLRQTTHFKQEQQKDSLRWAQKEEPLQGWDDSAHN
jgi:hypothetical protein